MRPRIYVRSHIRPFTRDVGASMADWAVGRLCQLSTSAAVNTFAAATSSSSSYDVPVPCVVRPQRQQQSYQASDLVDSAAAISDATRPGIVARGVRSAASGPLGRQLHRRELPVVDQLIFLNRHNMG
jgi:hypothetical protein